MSHPSRAARPAIGPVPDPPPAGIRRDDLIGAPRRRRDNPVVVHLAGFSVPVTAVRYHPGRDTIVLAPDPRHGRDTLEIIAEDGPHPLARRLDRREPW